MSIAHLLEDFGTVRFAGSPRMSDVDLETLKLEAFENGYKAGWEDALKSRTEEQDRISGDFARNLEDLSFTYHEAHAHVMQAMGPLLQDIVNTVLPEAIRASIGIRVVEQLSDMARTVGTQKVEIVAALPDVDAVNGLLTRDFGFPIEVTEDATLAQGQVFLRMAQDERQIDMDSVLTGIREAVAALMEESERNLKHG